MLTENGGVMDPHNHFIHIDPAWFLWWAVVGPDTRPAV